MVSQLALGEHFSGAFKVDLEKLKSLEQRPNDLLDELNHLKLNLRNQLVAKRNKDERDRYRTFVILTEKLIDEFFKLTKECVCKVVKPRLSEEVKKKKPGFDDRVEYICNLIYGMDIHDIFSAHGEPNLKAIKVRLRRYIDIVIPDKTKELGDVYNFIYNALSSARNDLFPELVKVLNKIIFNEKDGLIKIVDSKKWDALHKYLENCIVELDKTIELVEQVKVNVTPQEDSGKLMEEIKKIFENFSCTEKRGSK
jgi:hypothetical protein